MTDPTTRTLHLPDGYTSRAKPEYFNDAPNLTGATVYQPDVYAFADYLVRSTGRSTLIDVGCGSARKLMAVSAKRTIGLDFEANIATCRAQWPGKTWVELDLENGSLPAMADIDLGDAVVVNSDVIEHLVDPSNLIRQLKSLYDRGAIVLISTPDRPRSRGIDHMGPPGNPAHVREWALDELVALLGESGLPATFSGYTINHSRKPKKSTILTVHDPVLNAAKASGTLAPAATVFVAGDASDAERRRHRAVLEDLGLDVRIGGPDARRAFALEHPDRWHLSISTREVPGLLWVDRSLSEGLGVLATAGFDSLPTVPFATAEALPAARLPERGMFLGLADAASGAQWQRGPNPTRPAPYAAHVIRWGAALPWLTLGDTRSVWLQLRSRAKTPIAASGDLVHPETFLEDYLVERLSDVAVNRAAFLARLT